MTEGTLQELVGRYLPEDTGIVRMFGKLLNSMVHAMLTLTASTSLLRALSGSVNTPAPTLMDFMPELSGKDGLSMPDKSPHLFPCVCTSNADQRPLLMDPLPI